MIVAVVTFHTSLASMPGTTFLPATVTGLPRDSVVNVTGRAALDQTDPADRVEQIPAALMNDVDEGLRRALAL